MDFISSDRTLKVGDYVFNNYSKNTILWKVTKIERRFLNQSDLKSSVYAGGQVGDEWNPYVVIEAVADFGVHTSGKKLRKQVKGFDAAWVTKVDPKVFQDHIDRLKKLVSDFWP